MTTRVSSKHSTSLSEWKQIDRAVPFWVFRHFFRKPADTTRQITQGSLPEITDAGGRRTRLSLDFRALVRELLPAQPLSYSFSAETAQ